MKFTSSLHLHSGKSIQVPWCFPVVFLEILILKQSCEMYHDFVPYHIFVLLFLRCYFASKIVRPLFFLVVHSKRWFLIILVMEWVAVEIEEHHIPLDRGVTFLYYTLVPAVRTKYVDIDEHFLLYIYTNEMFRCWLKYPSHRRAYYWVTFYVLYNTMKCLATSQNVSRDHKVFSAGRSQC